MVADLFGIEPQPWQAPEWNAVRHHLHAIPSGHLEDCCRTFWQDDQPIALAGATEKWPGSWVGWSVLGWQVHEDPIPFLRAYRKMLDEEWEARHMHRLEVTGRADQAQLPRWMDFLGFAREGYCHQYTLDRQDVVLYARVRA